MMAGRFVPVGCYTTAQAARIACVTARQLQWWDEQGILSPCQVEHRRVYAPRQVMGAMLFRELQTRGFSLAAIRKVWLSAQRQGFEMPAESRRWMLTDGARVVFLAEAATVLAFLEQRRTPAYVLISLGALAERWAAESAVIVQRLGPGRAQSAEPGRGVADQVREA